MQNIVLPKAILTAMVAALLCGVAQYQAPLSVADEKPAAPQQQQQKQKATEDSAQTAESFTIAVLPDTQFYCDCRLKLSAKWGNGDLRRYFFKQTEWVRDNQQRLNIKFLVHEGDIVQADAPEEWAIAKEAMSVLDGKVPYCMCLGNHDMGFEKSDNKYGGNIGVNRTTHFNTYFPRAKFAKRHEFGGTFDPDRHDNSWYHFEAAGMKFLIVALEYHPRDEVLDWANRIVAEHPEHRAIVLTHAYLRGNKTRTTNKLELKGNNGEQMWQKFVRKHKNMFMVLCGHFSGEAVLTSAGDHGNQVHQVLCDYQQMNNGGESWLRYMVFKPKANKISIHTYNPALDKFRNGPSSRFDLDYPMSLAPLNVPEITRPGSPNSQPAFRMASIFTDHMVLQRDQSLPVWGWAASGRTVTVEVGPHSARTRANAEGRWQVTLPSLESGKGPLTMTAKAGDKTIRLTDILVGEVWLCSGQSNMEMTVAQSADGKAEIKAANHPNIRLFNIPRPTTLSTDPQDDVVGQWQACSPETIGDFSAVGYYFGREIHQSIEVPVGLINASWGGTIIETWTRHEEISRLPGMTERIAEAQDIHRDPTVVPKDMTAKEKRAAKLHLADFKAKAKYKLAFEASQERAAKSRQAFNEARANDELARKMSSPDLDVRSWKTMEIPNQWGKEGLPDYRGMVWFRKTIDVPKSWAGKNLVLHLDRILEGDVTWFNGQRVGATPVHLYHKPRVYSIPANLVKAGANTITVRVVDTFRPRGMSGNADAMALCVAGSEETDRIGLAGPWRYKPEVQLHAQLPYPDDQVNHPTLLYNTMIHPVVPFAIRGITWYQGEQNNGDGMLYFDKMQALIQSWRNAFLRPDAPFYFVQIAPYRYGGGKEQALPELWEAQTAALEIPHTGMAVISDIGHVNWLHPSNKQDVGKRLALWALAKDYGQDNLVYSGPLYKSMAIEGSKIRLSFNHSGSGLASRDAKPLDWFEIAGKDGKFVKAQAVIDGNTVVVSSDAIAKPTAARFAWGQVAVPNLMNKEGLPAGPFRTRRRESTGRPLGGQGLLKRMPNEAMPDKYLRFKADPVKRAESQSFHRDRTAPDWRQAMPIGNGDFGAAVHGYPDNLTFHIGKNDLSWDNQDKNQGYPSTKFAELRKRLKAGEEAELKKEIDAMAKEAPCLPVETNAGKFRLKLHESATFHSVREKLDLANGIASIRYVAELGGGPQSQAFVTVESFVSREDEVMVVHAQARNADATLGVVRLEFYRGATEIMKGSPIFQGMSLQEIDSTYQPKPHVENDLVWFEMALKGGDAYGPDEYIMMMGCDSGKFQAGALGPDIYGRFRPDAGPVTFYITVVSNNDIRGPWADPRIKGQEMLNVAKARIRAALDKGYEAVRKSHTDWWNNYWRRGWVAMPDANDEHPWYWSLYKVASAQRPGKVCPGYNGPWRNNSTGSWGYFIYNYEETKQQMGILSNNRCELVEPLNAVAFNSRELMRKQTQEYFGMDGLHYPHSMTYRGYISPYRLSALNVETSGEAIKYAWDYYDYTGDKEFLREVAYPLLKGVADFYLDYLLEDANGNYYIFPSYWTEHPNFLDHTSINDLSIFHMIFRDATKAAKVLEVDADRVAKWQTAREKMLPYNVNKDGVWVASWESAKTGFFPNSTANSQMYPIAITDQVDAWHGPKDLRSQARATYEHYLGTHPYAWDKSTSYIAAARMGDREYMKKIYGIQYKLLEGGYISPEPQHGDGEWTALWTSGYTPDPCSGYPAGIVTESMLQSHGGDIRLFPANPLEGHYAFHSLRARGAFLVSSEMRDGKVPYALIQSLVGNRCNLVQPLGQGVDVQVRDLESGKIVKQIDAADADQIISFETTAKHIYVIERKDVPLEKVPVVEL